MSTASSVRSVDGSSRALPTGTRSCLGITRSSLPGADTREVLQIRLRKGSANTQKGMLRFTDELVAHVARAGASGSRCCEPTRDSGNEGLRASGEAGWQYSIGVRLQKGITRQWRRSRRAPGPRSRTTHRRGGTDRRDHVWRATVDRQTHPAARSASRAVARLAILLFRHGQLLGVYRAAALASGSS
jgi:hypothetical protein